MDQQIKTTWKLSLRGEAIPEITDAIRSRKSEKAQLTQRLLLLKAPHLDARELRRERRAAADNYRALLNDNPSEGRDLLRVLIDEQLVAHPVKGEPTVEIRGTDIHPLVARVIQNLASPPGQPVLYLEGPLAA